jgi:hypothetical protein
MTVVEVAERLGVAVGGPEEFRIRSRVHHRRLMPGGRPSVSPTVEFVVTEDDIRRMALSLPHTSEKPSYGRPGFRVKDRLFARIREDGDLLAVWVESEPEKLAMIDAEPAKFTTTPHYDGHPMVLVRFEGVDTTELAELLTESWRLRAPAKVRGLLD